MVFFQKSSLIENMNRQNTTEHGFTLLEMMITLVIAGILLAIVIPSYRALDRNQCATSKANALISSFQYARSEAVKQHTDISILANNASGSNEWGDGWTVWIDTNGDGGLDAGETRLREVDLACNNTTMDETANTTLFIYASDGSISTPATASTFDICDDRTGENRTQVGISALGRPTTTSPPNAGTCP